MSESSFMAKPFIPPPPPPPTPRERVQVPSGLRSGKTPWLLLLLWGSAQETGPKEPVSRSHLRLYSTASSLSLFYFPQPRQFFSTLRSYGWGGTHFYIFSLKSIDLELVTSSPQDTLKSPGFWMTKARDVVLISTLCSILPLKRWAESGPAAWMGIKYSDESITSIILPRG